MAPTATAQEAARAVIAYRSPHVIEPTPSNDPYIGYTCRKCGIGIHEIKGGWRHNDNEIGRLAAIADAHLLYPIGEAR